MKITLSPGLVSLVVAAVYRLLMCTVRVRMEGDGSVRKLWDEGQPVVLALWHNELFCLPSLRTGSRWVAIVSASKDGEYLARILNRLDIDTARGSSSRQGLAALMQAVRVMRAGGGRVNGVVTVDGPRGPRHVAKDGAVFLAQKAGARLVPARTVYSRKWVFEKAWDRFELPKPFSTARVVFGEPYAVPEGRLRGEALRKEVRRLEERLHALV